MDLEAGQRVTFIKLVEIALFILAIITLALEALFIFRPAEIEIKKTMQILAVNEDNIRKLFDIAPTPMLLVSTSDLSIIRLNQMATEALQLHFDEAIGRKLYDFMSSEYTKTLDVIEEEHYNGQTRKMEVIVRDSQGNSYFMLMSVARISYYEDIIFLIGFSDYTDIKKKEQKLELLATVDEMTGLTNRRTGLAILEKSLELCKRERMKFSVCFIDLDGLKNVNDVFGHREGDWFIKSAASILMNSARAEDTVFRYGGDEIVMILSNCEEECGRSIMKRVMQEISELNLKSGKPFKVDLSYGIESCTSETDHTVQKLIDAADEKMYKQKDGKKLSKNYPKQD